MNELKCLVVGPQGPLVQHRGETVAFLTMPPRVGELLVITNRQWYEDYEMHSGIARIIGVIETSKGFPAASSIVENSIVLKNEITEVDYILTVEDAHLLIHYANPTRIFIEDEDNKLTPKRGAPAHVVISKRDGKYEITKNIWSANIELVNQSMKQEEIWYLDTPAILDLYEEIKNEQYRFVITGEDGYDWGIYIIQIFSPLSKLIVEVKNKYIFGDENTTLIDSMKEALVELLKLEPNFFYKGDRVRNG